MRKSVLFIAKFDNILKSMNTVLAKSFNMQMCPPEPTMVEKTLDVIEIDLILLYISGLPIKILIALCDRLYDTCLQTPIIVFGTADECADFDKYCSIAISKYMHRPIAAQDITNAILELLEAGAVVAAAPKPKAAKSISLADFAGLLQPEEIERQRCILLVDDDGRILRAMKMLLEKNYKVTLANSGMSAIAAIERNRPDAVLLDYEMPVVDGKRTLEMIRDNPKTRDLPVFFLTGVADKERIKEVIHLKPQGYFLKSSEQSAIIERLEAFFRDSNG